MFKLIEDVAKKIATNLAKKEAKKTGKAENILFALFFGQISRGITISTHFIQRVQQRFEAQEQEELTGAIARAIRNTQILESGSNHIAKAQKFVDEITNIVVVLERAGTFGALLVTTYKRGQENLISDEEYESLKTRGLL